MKCSIDCHTANTTTQIFITVHTLQVQITAHIAHYQPIFIYKFESVLSWEYYKAYHSLAHWPQGNTSFKMHGNLAEYYKY